MSPHACDGHACDHCYRCDVLGECCQTPVPGERAHPPAAVQRDLLHDAVAHDARAAVALGELVRLESGRPGIAVLLLPGSVAEPIPNHSPKEKQDVPGSRALR